MMQTKIEQDYYAWVCDLVCDGDMRKQLRYDKLLEYLYDQEFVYILDMDSNRAAYGIDLRYRFTYEYDIPNSIMQSALGDKPCSILEMMAALALNCEEHIMDNPDIGNRTSKWFWDMIDNLGLSNMTSSKFELGYANMVINRFLNRRYEPNGRGGLFILKHCRQDLRDVDIWYQMMWYLNENFDFSI